MANDKGEGIKAGDMVICVRGGFIRGPNYAGVECPKAGRFYTVDAVVPAYQFNDGRYLALRLKDGPPNRIGDHTWGAFRFRKIEAHEPDAEDRETIGLLDACDRRSVLPAKDGAPV